MRRLGSWRVFLFLASWEALLAPRPGLAFWVGQPFAATGDLKSLEFRSCRATRLNAAARRSLPPSLIDALDLDALILDHVAIHCGTKRGRDALRSLVEPQKQLNQQLARGGSGYRCTVATCRQEAIEEYERVQQAMWAWNNGTCPPIYGPENHEARSLPTGNDKSNPSFSSAYIDDFDDWLIDHNDPSEFTLNDLLEAEQMIQMLLKVHRWAERETTPLLLAQIGRKIHHEELQVAHHQLENTVKLQRVRSATDPNGSWTFQFSLNEKVFPALQALSSRARDPEELEVKRREIQYSLAVSVLACRSAMVESLSFLAQLDTLLAKAAFGLNSGGTSTKKSSHDNTDWILPIIEATDDGLLIHVPQFMHPLIDQAVPIDLKLSQQALVITGANGGGKTAALKSFGLVATMVWLGLPVPTLGHQKQQPTVAWVDNLHVQVGDGQDLANGDSTFTARLKGYASLLQSLKNDGDDLLQQPANSKRNHLILLDELGSGTDDSGGGAISQALLEQLLAFDQCHVVATTHSRRLKDFALEQQSAIECAAVLRSSYELFYGIVGESYGIEAARKCALPPSLLDRAAELMQQSDNTHAEVRLGLEAQVDAMGRLRQETEYVHQQTLRCQVATVHLANAYERQLSLWEERLAQSYQQLLQEKPDEPLEVVGETLDQVRVTKKRVQNRAEQLRERGMRPLLRDDLTVGASVVIVNIESEFEGCNGIIASVMNAQNQIIVSLSSSGGEMTPFDGWVNDGPTNGSSEVVRQSFRRDQLAAWDYVSAWDDLESKASFSTPVVTKASAIKRLQETICSIQKPRVSSPAKEGRRAGRAKINPAAANFQSARERRQARRANSSSSSRITPKRR